MSPKDSLKTGVVTWLILVTIKKVQDLNSLGGDTSMAGTHAGFWQL